MSRANICTRYGRQPSHFSRHQRGDEKTFFASRAARPPNSARCIAPAASNIFGITNLVRLLESNRRLRKKFVTLMRRIAKQSVYVFGSCRRLSI